jgi:hypothetical protein
MDDDERLAALFREAASDPAAPPPRFGHDDVVATSRRITARRRSAALGAAAVIGLVGLGAAVVLPGDGGESLTSAAAPASAPEAARDSAGSGSGPGELSEPYAGDADAGGAAGSAEEGAAPPPAAAPVAPPLGPGAGECADRQDPALRALVEQVLPEAVGAPPAATTDVCLPGTERYLALEVTDGAARGVLAVGYLPPGSLPQVPPGTLTAPTASGGTVLVGSTADGPGPGPYADRLPALLDHLAARL